MGLVLCGANYLEVNSVVSDVLSDINDKYGYILAMPKRRHSSFWLHKPKQNRFPRFVTPKKNISATATPRKNTSSAFKRLNTPESLSKCSKKKKNHIYANPSPKVISENIIYDEVEETISETSKEYINIATDKKVIEKLTEAGLLYHFTLFFGLVKKQKNICPGKLIFYSPCCTRSFGEV